jgi:hypothetical protein
VLLLLPALLPVCELGVVWLVFNITKLYHTSSGLLQQHTRHHETASFLASLSLTGLLSPKSSQPNQSEQCLLRRSPQPIHLTVLAAEK